MIENGLLANTFSGEGLGNENFGEGPDGEWEWPAITNRPYAYARTDYAPIGLNGWYTWTPGDPPTATPVNTLTDDASFFDVPQEVAGASFDPIYAAEDDS